MKNILVTCALPYSNGPIHLGHILENVQADIWVRHQKMLGNKVYFICADDAHGTAVMLKANELELNPELMVNNILNQHKDQFLKFNIFHDIYHTTHNNTNYFYSLLFLNNLKKKKLLYKKKIYQFYDNKKGIFLPDRFIKGKCPNCKSNNQYGDVCENCNSIYNSFELLNPISLLSNSKPSILKTEHLFVNISYFKKNIYNWILLSNINIEIKNQLFNWLENNLFNWNISRDSPYFGFKIPNIYIKNKYFYVWLDALISYLSVFKIFSMKNDFNIFNDFWNLNSNYEIYHIIGKDIIYFHGLLLPVILDVLNVRKPTGIIVHGHVKINGIKMSKSKNNFISSKEWLKNFDSDSLRYYFASKLNNNMNDINLCIDDFIKTINYDLVYNFINIASRIYYFINKYFNNFLCDKLYNINIYNLFVNKSYLISNYYINFNYYKVLIEINKLNNLINKYINDYKPWDINNILYHKYELHKFCTLIINLFKVVSIYLYPIIPNIFNNIEIFLNIKLYWKSIYIPLLNHKICKYNILYKCIKKKIFNFN